MAAKRARAADPLDPRPVRVLAPVWGRQNELSLATGLFLLAGAGFSVMNLVVFPATDAPRPDLVALIVVCSIAAALVFVRGRRLSHRTVGVLMLLVLLTVVPSVLIAPTLLRAMNLGVLFLPFFVYLVWFMPMWFARLLGYSWLVAYAGLLVYRFGPQVTSLLMTLGVTGVVLGELIGRFKNRLERTSITDPLCQVWNKRGFAILLRKSIGSAQRNGQPLSVLYLDLDDFKSINDLQGHSVGDQVLQTFARDLQAQSRPEDVLARFGGDEFALLLIDTDAAGAARAAARLRRAIPEPAWSFGVSEWHSGEDSEAIISRADLRMLQEKRGRKRGPEGTLGA